MATSLNQVCAALGKTGSVSLCKDILGFDRSRVPSALTNTRPVPRLNINRFVRLLRGKHFHVHLIITGSDLLTDKDRDFIDYAVFRLRDIYTAAGIGIGIVTRELRTAANSAGHAVLRTRNDASKTGHDITADGDFVPVVFPADMNVTEIIDGLVITGLGVSPRNGPCSPRNRDDMNSTVVDFSREEGGRTLAHEVGHFLGADHTSGLMSQDTSIDGDPFFVTTIIESDRTIMMEHCVIRSGLQTI
jgi:hypothetical protein